MPARFPTLLGSLFVLIATTGCPSGGGDSGSKNEKASPSGETSVGEALLAGEAAKNDRPIAEVLAEYGYTEADLEIPTVRYEWDPKVGDKSVPAEQGGPGFTGEGWETRMEFPALGSSEAKKGGRITLRIPDWPATLRMEGENWNTWPNYRVRDLCYSAMVNLNYNDLGFMPGLATHWKISDDKMTYRFRLNPAARWSDGVEVTADDIVETWKMRIDPSHRFPSSPLVLGKFTMSKESKYIVRVECKQENWRNFLYAGGMPVLPAHELNQLPEEDRGAAYVDKYQFSYTALCGPYKVEAEDIVEGVSLTLTRNPDWWDADNPAWTGLYNFDEVRWTVVQDDNLAYEKAKKGEIDFYVIRRAKWYADDLPKQDAVKRGVLARRKFYSDAPVGTQGVAINMNRKPLDDVRVRKALAHLYNRDLWMDKLFYNEYDALTSYWQYGDYQNTSNEKIDYDPYAADELLTAAGWALGDDGIRRKDGEALSLNLMYRSKSSELFITPYQEACKKLGIDLQLSLYTPSQFWKNLQDKQYQLAVMAWGALVIPNPETSWSSELAQKPGNNNVTAFANDEVDKLLVEYDNEYDVTKRAEIIRQMDAIIYEQHPYILSWGLFARRAVTVNKFGTPKWGVTRSRQDEEMFFSWWVEPELEAVAIKGFADSSVTMEAPPEKVRFWPAWNALQTHRRQSAAAGGTH